MDDEGTEWKLGAVHLSMQPPKARWFFAGYSILLASR
jgi:hypothetical protein